MSDQIEEIKTKIDIVSLIGEFIELKKAGRNYKALCPFHSEKTPSFIVSSELQIFKCFGCGEAGDVYAFLQKYEGMDFYESLKYLANRAGIKLITIKTGEKSEKEKLYEINNLALRFYHYLLTNHPVGKTALSYLLKGRGLKQQTVETFKIGYSPENPLAFKKFLVDRRKIPAEYLQTAGLVYIKNGQLIDRFRGRVIFPLYDHRENIVGFAGRILPSKESLGLAKYVNSPETPVYHKSSILYGLNITKHDIKDKKQAVIVEGELDLISSWQAGLKNVVAIKGSSLTQEQVKLLSRFTEGLVLALDTDIAGDSAARRGIEIAEKEGLDIRVARLGEFKDPDEMARKSPERLTEIVEKSIGIWDFLIDSAFKRFKGVTGSDKAKISRELVPILSAIADKIVQAHYIEVVAKKLGVPTESVAEQITRSDSSLTSQSIKLEETIIKKETKTRRELLEERLLSLCLNMDPSILLKKENIKLISTPLCKRIADELVKFMKKHKDFDPSLFASEIPSELVSGFTDMVLKNVEDMNGEDPMKFQKEIEVLRKEIKILDIREQLENVGKKIQEFELGKKIEELEKAQKKFGELTNDLNELEE